MAKADDKSKVLDVKSDSVVTLTALCQILGISNKTGSRLKADGIFEPTGEKTKVGADKFLLSYNIQRYVSRELEKQKKQLQPVDVEALKRQKLEAEISLKNSQSELHRLKTAHAQGKYISVEDVKLDYEKFFLIFKKFAMSIPSRVGGAIAGYVEPVVGRGIEKDLQTEVNSMLRSFVVAAASPGSDVL